MKFNGIIDYAITVYCEASKFGDVDTLIHESGAGAKWKLTLFL